MVEWMIERFPNGINLQDSQGRTPLHWAAKDSKTYNLLLDNGANTSIVDQVSAFVNILEMSLIYLKLS